MNLQALFKYLLPLLCCWYSLNTQAQDVVGIREAKVVGDDTFYVFDLDSVQVLSSGLSPEQLKYWWNLRANVRKVYPYSILAAHILEETEQACIGMSKRQRREYLRKKEKELREKYKHELKNLTITQGKILVKLINRHTGRDAYSLIKELRGGITARISQTGAYLYDNNLKATYDPYGEDRDIEAIVKEIEAEGKWIYKPK